LSITSAAKAFSVNSRRSPTTRWVVSLTAQNTPGISPLSAMIGL
jgi:hypothetical protein